MTTLVDRLIEQADGLAGTWTTEPGRPRPADLRRAVSAAYYALFHELTHAVSSWMAPSLATEDRERMRRHFTHAGMKRVCGWVANPGGAPTSSEHVAAIATVAARSIEIAAVASTFVALQSRRHEADYDHLASFSRDSVRSDIQEADSAITYIRWVAETPEMEAFSILIALHGGNR